MAQPQPGPSSPAPWTRPPRWDSTSALAPLLCGYLTKQGEKYKTWKRRWFEVFPTEVAYYKGPGDVVPKGVIPLDGRYVVAVSPDEFSRDRVFALVHQADRTYYLQAATADDLAAWMLAIDSVIADLLDPAAALATLPAPPHAPHSGGGGRSGGGQSDGGGSDGGGGGERRSGEADDNDVPDTAGVDSTAAAHACETDADKTLTQSASYGVALPRFEASLVSFPTPATAVLTSAAGSLLRALTLPTPASGASDAPLPTGCGEAAVVASTARHADLITAVATRGTMHATASHGGEVAFWDGPVCGAGAPLAAGEPPLLLARLQLDPHGRPTAITFAPPSSQFVADGRAMAGVVTDDCGVFVVQTPVAASDAGTASALHIPALHVAAAAFLASGHVLVVEHTLPSSPSGLAVSVVHPVTGATLASSPLALPPGHAAHASPPRVTASVATSELLAVATSSRALFLFDLSRSPEGAGGALPTAAAAACCVPGSGAPRAIALAGDVVAVPSDNGTVSMVAVERACTSEVGVALLAPLVLDVAPGVVFALGMDAALGVLVVLTETGARTFALPDVRGVGGGGAVAAFHTSSCFSLVACGVALSPDASLVAGGDFHGTLHVFERGESAASVVPAASASIGNAVRAVAWDPCGARVVAGTLDGRVMAWNVETGAVDEVAVVEGGVTCVEFSPSGDGSFAVGTTGGVVAVFADSSSGSGWVEERAFVAHPPAPQDAPDSTLFGSLKLFAEVWSLAHAPPGLGRLLATCSEDQTVRVFDVEGGRRGGDPPLLATLGGHTLAVTCVDWAECGSGGGSVLVSVADDRTALVWQTVRGSDGVFAFDLVARYSTATLVRGWHTLTYVAIDAEGGAAHVVTQNGHLVSFPLAAPHDETFDAHADVLTPPHARRIHSGSVEGIHWSPAPAVLLTCSADCSISEFVSSGSLL